MHQQPPRLCIICGNTFMRVGRLVNITCLLECRTERKRETTRKQQSGANYQNWLKLETTQVLLKANAARHRAKRKAIKAQVRAMGPIRIDTDVPVSSY